MQPAKDVDRVTDEQTYLNRRNFLRAGILTASVVATGWAYRKLNSTGAGGARPRRLARALHVTTAPATNPAAQIATGIRTDDKQTPFEKITHYNNFYEFSTDKEAVAEAAQNFVARPWTVTVDGLVAKPKTFDLDDLLNLAPIEERIYRMRCVEAWSMVIPWDGYSLSKLLDRVEPRSSAKYVAFTTLLDPKRMPNQRTRRSPLALRRGPAHGRGHASAHDPRIRNLRQRAARHRMEPLCGWSFPGNTASRASNPS